MAREARTAVDNRVPHFDMPDGWRIVRIRDVTLKAEQSDPRSTATAELRYVDVSGVSRESLRIESSTRHRGAQAPSRARKKVRAGDVLFATVRPSLRRVAMVPPELDGQVCSTAFCVIRADSMEADPSFLFFATASGDFVRRVSSHQRGSSYPAVTDGNVLDEEILLPSLGEQRAIASVLRAVLQAKAATAKVVTAMREVRRSLMRYLFTYGVVPTVGAGDVKLRETEIGSFPKHWRTARIDDLAEVKGGKRLPKGHSFSSVQTPYPYIRVVDFKNGSVDTSDLRFLHEDDHRALTRYVISSRDVYLSIAGTIGRVGVIPNDLDGAHLTENAARLIIRTPNVLNRDFLAAFLSSERGQEQIRAFTGKTSQPKLALARIKQIVMPVPPLSEQEQIAGTFGAIDAKVRAEEARRAALEATFTAALSELMTGRRRVAHLEVA